MVTLDVRNAFNTASWAAIDEAVQQKGILEYMIFMMKSYMTDRAVLVNDGVTQREMEVFCEVSQGSVLGPALWNIFCDGLLRLCLSRAVCLIGFPDDMALTVTRHTTKELERTTATVLDGVRD